MELEGKSINKQTKKFETPNKHSFNKPSTKKNTQNYCFLRYYNAIIYENWTLEFSSTLVVDNVAPLVLTSKSFETYFLKKSNMVVDFFIIYK